LLIQDDFKIKVNQHQLHKNH